MAYQDPEDMEEYSPSEDLNDEAQGTISDLNNAYEKGKSLKNQYDSLKNAYDNAGNNGAGNNAAQGNDSSSDGASKGDASGSGNNAKDSAKGATKDGAKDSAKDAAKEGAKDAAKEGAKDVVKEGAKTAAKEGAKTAAKGAAGAAAGAATGGIATAVMAAAEGAKKLMEVTEKAAKEAEKESSSKSGPNNGLMIILGITLAASMIPALLISSLEKTIGGSLSMYTSDQTYNAAQTTEEINSATNEKYEDYYSTKNAGTKKKSFYEGALKLVDQVFNWINGILGDDEKEGPLDVADKFREGAEKSVDTIKEVYLQRARTDGAKGGQIEKDINIIIRREDYDSELTWDSFDSEYDIFEEMNFAEFLSIMTELEEYNSENATYEDLENLGTDVHQIRLLYRLHLETAYITKLEAGRCEKEYDTNGNWTNEAECNEEIKYGIVTLRRYYLRDLFEFFKLDANEVNYEFTENAEHLSSGALTTNIDLLDRLEPTMRSYASVTNDKDSDPDNEELLGPNVRTEYDGEPTDTPIDDNDEYIYNTGDTAGTNQEIIFDTDGVTIAHGQIGAEIGDITDVAKNVAQLFMNRNSFHPYSVTTGANFSTAWGTYWVYPCCAGGTTLTLKAFGLKATPASATSVVASSSYIGSRVNATRISDLRVGDVLTYGSHHTEIVTKIDGSTVYIAGFGSDGNIAKDADHGYNKTVSKSSSITALTFQQVPTVWRPNESTFNFSE